MNNIMTISGQQAIISFDPEINLFRGEFVGLAQGGADFYASDVKGLLREGKRSLAAYVEMCREDSVEPFQTFSGRFNARIPPSLHAKAKAAAAASGKSLNQWIVETLEAATV